jgi:general secretion pathway protein D
LGNFDQAHAHYQKVLGIDPTNSAARRGMERVAKAKSDYAKAAADQTRAEMLSQVEAGWEMPVNAPTLDMTTLDPGDDTGSAPSPRVPLSLKIERIVLPTFMLSEASLEEAVDLLRQRSVEFDLSEADPALRGINFDLQLGSAESPAGNAIRAKRLTLSLNSIPIAKALDYITSQTRTTYSTDGYAVVIRPLEAESNTLETRTFRVPPDFLVILGNESRKSGADDPFADKPGQGLLTERLGAREVLVKNGVRFPEGAGATLSNGRLAVTNTPANLAVVEAIVDSVAKTEPVMVVVTATIIKCTETRYKELSFDSMLGEIGFGGASWIPGADKLNFTGGTKGTGGDLGDMTLPTGQTSSNPITAGNRSGDEAAYIDSIDGAIARSFDKGRSSLSIPRSPGAFQVTKILDDSSATMILRGMARQKGVDVTTAASTVTTSGQASSVRSVREMRYPQAYEPPELPNSVGGDNDFNNNGGFGGGGRAPNAVTPSHPTDFTTREIGTILEVTPTADPEKRYVDVALVNTVTDFDGFVDWGSPINEPVTRTFAAVVNPLNARAVQISPNYILQPVFSMNRTTTSVSVADGQTIVISGMLQDRINRVNDRTPGYSRLPLIGRLFESDIDQPSSTAVVFMIKVRLVDPTGQPYNEREAPAER